MPFLIPGSTTSVTATTTSQTVALSPLAKAAARLQIINNGGSNNIAFVRITNTTEMAPVTTADIPIPVTTNNPMYIDKKAGEDRISVMVLNTTAPLYITGVDGYQ